MSIITRILAVASLMLATIVAGPNVATGSQLGYESRNGVCEIGELCLYSSSGQRGSIYDFGACESASDYWGRTFINSSRSLDDSVESVWNRSGDFYKLFVDPDFQGESESVLVTPEKQKLWDVDDEVSSHLCTEVP
jgi:hypothetical protein